MAKESKGTRPENRAPHHDAPTGESGGGMNTGVAIVGFVLCFVAGALLMFGYDKHQQGKSADITSDVASKDGEDHHGKGSVAGAAGPAWSDEAAAIPISSKDPMWGKRDAPVTIVQFSRLPVPVLLARRADARPGAADVRPGQGPHRLEEQPAALPPERQARGRSRRGRLRARGQRRVLEVPRHRVQEPGRPQPRQLREVGQGRGREGHGRVQGGPRQPQVGRQGRQGRRDGKAAGVQGTPSFFINGVFINGAQPFDNFKKTIDQELAEGPGQDRRRARQGRQSTSRWRRRTRRTRRRRRRRGEAAKDDTTTVFKVPVGTARCSAARTRS